ncbi:hypothetical protein CEXT_524921 [Caerostris extrusa]|uniref:Uncharacterized protein n=1 Tax=Caerostris extrusa TaxID=172846 RepID=A0AAV4W0K7_CAEEX|nr:hypothetical protein CEXT_524921 [Caerostris extrusa]
MHTQQSQLTGGSLPEYQEPGAECCPSHLAQTLVFTVNIVFHETPQPKFRSGRYPANEETTLLKMTADHLCTCEILS